MKVKQGDVLTCACGECKVELTVTKTCTSDVCGHDQECEVNLDCCGEAMTLKS